MNNNHTPKMLPPIYCNIPDEMRCRRQWVGWKLAKSESPNGKPYTKIPLNPTKGGKASTTRPWTWGTLATARDRHERYSAQDGRGEVQGVGYVLQEGEVGIDLDGCRDPATGALAGWAKEIIERICSYTEVSPSGTGIRIICKGQLPPGARRKGPVEMYDHSSPRYLTITGHRLFGTALEPRQAEIEEIHSQHLGKEVEKATSAAAAADVADDLDLTEVLDMAFHARNGEKFKKLWRGEWEGDYPSQSEADLALSSMLAFYCGPQPDLIDAFFRRSGLMRDKWERPDYREGIIQKATDKSEFYDWCSVTQEDVEAVVRPVELKELSGPSPLDDPATIYEATKGPSKKERRRRAYTISELAALPAPQWHIRGLFPQGAIVILWGQAAAGKSFLAIDWGLCTATGKDWLGREVHQGAVVYIAAEGGAGITKRCQRWCEYHRLEEPEHFRVIPAAFALIQNEELRELAEIIAELKSPPALIVIDTLNRNIGGSESSEDDMGAFIRAAELLQRAFNATICIVHHTGWNQERERGHSSLRGAADAMISVRKLGERITDEGIEITCVKQKDAEEFGRFGVTCVRVGEGDSSSVVLAREIDLDAMTTEQRQEESDRRLAQLIRFLPQEQDHAMTVREVFEQSGFKKTRGERLIDRGYNVGYILRVGLGIKGSPHRFYLSQAGQQLVQRCDGATLIEGL